MLGAPFIPVQCPSCGTALPVPHIPNTTRRLSCPFCRNVLEITIDRRGRARVSSTTFEEIAAKQVIEIARQNIEGFKKIGGAIFCPKCGSDVSSAKIRHKTEDTVSKAYTTCQRCGHELEWASVPLGRIY